MKNFLIEYKYSQNSQLSILKIIQCSNKDIKHQHGKDFSYQLSSDLYFVSFLLKIRFLTLFTAFLFVKICIYFKNMVLYEIIVNTQ